MMVMLMIVAAVAILMMMVMLMIVAAVAVLVMMVMLVIMTAAAMALFMMMVVLMLQGFQFLFYGRSAFHGLQKLLTCQLRPGSGDQGGSLIVLPQQLHRRIQLGLRNGIGTGQNDGGSSLDLVVIELAKVLHIDLDLTCIGNRHTIAQTDVLVGDLFHRCNNVGQLAHTGGLDDDPVRVILLDHLIQSLTKIAHKRAADTAGVHLRNVDAGLLQETAVDADLAEFIFDQHQLLTAISFLDHLFDEGGLTGTQKAGVNVDNCHFLFPFCMD